MDLKSSVDTPLSPAVPSQGMPSLFKEMSRETPSHGLTGVVVVLALPLGAAVVTFIFVGLFALAGEWSVKVPLVAAGGVGLVVLSWWIFEAPRLMFTVETVTGWDLNRDGHTGPPPVVNVTDYELHLNDHQQIRGRLTVEDALLGRWCEAARTGQSLAINRWKRSFAGPDGRHGRENYENFVDELYTQGLIVKVGGSVGIRLSRRGYEFIGAFLREVRLPERQALPSLNGARIGSASPPGSGGYVE